MKSPIALLVLCSLSLFAFDEQMHHHHDAGEQLGKVFFQTSCAPGSQAGFERGLALLHSFEYADAEQQFMEVGKTDPQCAMAHWGVAMSLFHQIWERPEDSTLKRGHDEIEKARAIDAKTDRERGYISALAIFYRDPSKNSYLKQAAAYS